MFLTIDGFESMTPQQIFDLSAKHMLTTKKKSVSDNGLCVYSGIGCAASVFLKDDEARRYCDALNPDAAEGKPSSESGWESLVNLGLAPKEHLQLLMALQITHDGLDGSEDDVFFSTWLKSIRNIARSSELDASILDQGE